MASKADRVRAAKARTTAAAAALVKHDTDKAAVEKAQAAGEKALAAYVKRTPQVVVFAANQREAMPFAYLRAGYGAQDNEKALREALESAAVKVRVGVGYGGMEYSVKGLTSRTRIPTKEGLSALAAAQRKHQRAKDALAHATQLLEDAKLSAYNTGAKITAADLIAVVAKSTILARKARSGMRADEDWTRRRLVTAVEEATKHELATRQGVECECQECVVDRREAERAKAEDARRASLPKITVKCAEHGTKRMPHEWVDRFVDQDKAAAWDLPKTGWQSVPIGYCPVDQRQVVLLTVYRARQAQLEKEATKAAKALAKAAKVKRGKTPEVEVDDLISYTCPRCDEVHPEARVLIDEHDGTLIVECDACEEVFALDEITPFIKKEAA